MDANKIFGGVANMVGTSRKTVNPSRFSNLNPQVSTDTQQMSNSTPKFSQSTFSNLGSITTPYGGQTKWEKFHPAVDVANKIGTPVPSFAGGKVIAVETGHKQGDKGFGNNAIIEDAQGNKWRYSHLKSSYVKVGQQVPKGAIVGEMGNTGSTYSNSGGTGSHLDLRVVDAYNRSVNPFLAIAN